MITVEHLTKRYGGHAAVTDLTFTVPEGKIYGLLGPNGAGKSTTMNMITGYIASTEGTVTIDGHDILEDAAEARRCIGYLPEQPPLYADMTVREYLRFVAELKGVARPERADQVKKVMNRTAVAQVQNRLIRNLSKGYKQRVGVAAALLGSPKVIILDEPTVGLDPAQVREMRTLIRQLGRKHTVILSSHILSEVQAVCDKVLILSHGRLAAEGSPEELAETLTARDVLLVTALGQPEQVQRAVAALPGVESAAVEGQKGQEITLRVQCAPGQDLRAAVSQALAAGGCPVLNLVAESMSLEDVFLEVTGGEAPPPEPQAQQEEGEADAGDL